MRQALIDAKVAVEGKLRVFHEGPTALGKEFGITAVHACNIGRGKVWRTLR